MLYLAGYIMRCEIKVVNPSVPSVASITLVPRNFAHGGGVVEVVTRLGDETVHFEPLDHCVVVVRVSLVNSQP